MRQMFIVWFDPESHATRSLSWKMPYRFMVVPGKMPELPAGGLSWPRPGARGGDRFPLSLWSGRPSFESPRFPPWRPPCEFTGFPPGRPSCESPGFSPGFWCWRSGFSPGFWCGPFGFGEFWVGAGNWIVVTRLVLNLDVRSTAQTTEIQKDF